MGVKKVWDKLVGTVGGVNEDDEFETDEYEDEEEMEEEQQQQRSTSRRTPAVAPRRSSGVGYAAPQEKPLRMVIVEPETFDDAQSIADYIRDRKPVVINFESTPDDIAKRVVDFVSGATYALDGNIQKVGKEIFLCVPSNVTVDHGKRDDYGDFNTPPLAWNGGSGNNNSGNTQQH
ncbi:cell division protein SepF [uncultured Megasphaera sp.]|uniref:cell division protein SepF n=1 Tax=Megasphaera sp. TaxID=2023260 RepID=UPI0025E9A443|nr:cell division protein SepF [uncultured Megasphaera sp.]